MVRFLDSEKETSKPISHSTNDFAIGSIAFARFRILEFIASGGNGRVYKAEDVLLNIMVALKVLLGEQSNADDVVRFQSEARAASRLKHPSIATIYDFGLVDHCPYLSMEFVEGETLEKLLRRTETLSLPAFCSLFLQLSKALSHAHENGVIHRDLKPANVIVRYQENGELVGKILDFGVAKLIDKNDINLTPTGNIVGSPLYMSPEQALGESVTSQADLYSLGVMMFTSLAGKVPIKSETAIETIMMVSKVPAPLLESCVPPGALPSELCDLVNKLLSKNPAERPHLESVVIPTLARLGDAISSQSQLEDDGDRLVESNSSLAIKNNLPKRFFSILAVVVSLGCLITFPALSLFKDNQTKVIDEDAPLLASISDKNEQQIFGLSQNTKDLNFKSEKGRLDFTNQKLTDDQLVKVPQPNSITTIRANSTQLETLNSIPRFPNLTHLSVGKTHVGDKSLKNLSGLKHLIFLDLQDNQITDAAIPMISKMRSLHYLDLSGTRVTPKGLKALKSIPNLDELKLRNSSFDKSDVEIFAPSLPPDCKVSLAGSSKITESKLQELSEYFPDLKFDDLSSQVFLVNKQMKVADEKNKSRPLNELLMARHVYLDLKARLENAYGKETLRTRNQIFILGNIERLIGKPDTLKKARDYYKTALSMAVQAHDGILEVEILDQQVLLGYLTDGFERTKPLALHAIELAEREKGNIKHPNKGIAYRYMQLGQWALLSGKTTEAIPFFTKAIDLSDLSTGTTACMVAYRGNAYVTLKKYNLAIADHKKALQLFKTTGLNDPSKEQRYMAELTATCYLAHSYYEINDYKQALKFNGLFYQLAHQPGVASWTHISESVNQRILLMQKLNYPQREIEPLRKEFAASQKMLANGGK